MQVPLSDPSLEPGLAAAFRYTVTEADTAAAAGSREVPVLATPRVLALAERATVAALAGALGAGATTVGTRVELDHLAPSPVGADLEVHAVLERATGRRLEFAVRLRDGDRLVTVGRVTRVVVDAAALLRDAGRTMPPMVSSIEIARPPDAGCRQSLVLHQMPESACGWIWLPAWINAVAWHRATTRGQELHEPSRNVPAHLSRSRSPADWSRPRSRAGPSGPRVDVRGCLIRFSDWPRPRTLPRQAKHA